MESHICLGLGVESLGGSGGVADYGFGGPRL